MLSTANLHPYTTEGDAQARKNKRSKVWLHFKEVLDDEGKIIHVQCTVAGCTAGTLKWSGCTTNLRNHLAAAHKQEFIEMERKGGAWFGALLRFVITSILLFDKNSVLC